MALLESAIALAARGFHVFPLREGGKLPAIKEYPTRATRDPATIYEWWGEWPNANIGISTTHNLLVVDVDTKEWAKGNETVLGLELEGYALPDTYVQHTPTGGRHFVYSVDAPVKQGTDVLGPGVDVRSKGGFIVGAGSVVVPGTYGGEGETIAPAPQWLIDRCGRAPERTEPAPPPENIDQDRAVERARHYLVHECPTALPGTRNDAGYRAAAKVKDMGVTKDTCIDLMLEFWNCEPMLDTEEVEHVVDSAYEYSQQGIGSASPEAQFEPVPADENDEGCHPFDEVNKEFAFAVAGGGHHILWETTDECGNFRLEHLHEGTFHKRLNAWTMATGDNKHKPVTELWMKSDRRRSYDGLCFRPGEQAPPGWYNLWRGFAVDPLPPGEEPDARSKRSVDMWLEHLRENVCQKNADLYRWLVGYFAHLVQKPGEKPLVALVFRGAKGVGKSAPTERVGALLGNHFLVASNRRYLTGNFNGHMENVLLFCLEEAFWSGDKAAEGQLKDLITGGKFNIEHKGKEPYKVDNRLRCVIIGNEDWIVPASHDERRYAVLDVTDGRKQDRQFFIEMREGMEAGGYRYLLRYLLDFDLTGIDVNDAPNTQALADQKVESLDPFHEWWLACLEAGRIIGLDFGDDWPEQIDKERFRAAIGRHVKERNIRSRTPESRAIGRQLAKCCPSITSTKRRENKTTTVQVYQLPDLATARKEWDSFIGWATAWE